MIKNIFLSSLFLFLFLLSPVSPAENKVDPKFLWLCRPDKCALFIETKDDDKIEIYEIPSTIEKEIFKRNFQETYKCT